MELRDALGDLRRTAQANDVAGAEGYARFILAGFPGEAPALHFAGHRLLTLGSYELSAACLAAAVAAEPTAERWNDLGVAQQRLGPIDRAIPSYRNALAVRAEYPEALGNLATALFLIGDYPAALPHAVRAVVLQPDNPIFATALAMIEGVIHGHDLALARLDATLAASPDAIPALTAKIYTLRRLERSADALDAARRLAALAPDGRSDELLGICLRDLGRYPEALAAFDAAIARSPAPATALANKAEALINLGDIDDARALLEAALAADPQSVVAWCGISGLRAFSAGDPDLDAMEALLEAPHVSVREDRTLLHFALGRAHLSAGNDERAFAHYAIGNRLHRSAIAYDVAFDELRADAIAAAVDANALRRLAGGPRSPADPIFVIGMPRSGTSLVEQILASVPGVHGAGELAYASAVIQADGPYPQNVRSLDVNAVERMGERYAALVAERAPRDARVVDKMPSNYLFAGLLHVMLPNARIVLCMRDRVDTALSLYTRLFSGRQDFAYDQIEIGRYYRAYERVAEHWRRLLPAHAFHAVAYEDIVTDFEPTVRRLLDFCGLPWAEECRRFHTTRRVVATASRTEVRQPLYRSGLGRARPYERYLEPLLTALGDR
jgi:tetratricopeptide (TPR) repeat protein